MQCRKPSGFAELSLPYMCFSDHIAALQPPFASPDKLFWHESAFSCSLRTALSPNTSGRARQFATGGQLLSLSSKAVVYPYASTRMQVPLQVHASTDSLRSWMLTPVSSHWMFGPTFQEVDSCTDSRLHPRRLFACSRNQICGLRFFT